MSAETPNGGSRRNQLIIAGIAVAAIIVGVLVFFLVRTSRQAQAYQNQIEQQLLDMAQADLEREYQDLNDEFAQFENSRKFITDDSIK
ncbi:MAG: hypothetical protein NC131_20360, partial [Roseburia sp.]|nr:hypothetical protein [Roseburia sp.]